MSSIKLRCLDDSSNNIFVVDSVQGVYSTNTTASTNVTTGGLVLYGGLSVNQSSNVSSVTRGGAVTIAGGVAIAKDLYVGGNIVSSNLGSTTASASFGQVSVFGTQDALNYTTGSVITVGGITVQDSTNASSITNGGALLVAGGASIARDVYIGGSLTVLGTQTSVVSQTLNIGDNLVVINSGPGSSRDAGVLIQRFQNANDSGAGDVVSDTTAFSTTFASASGTTAVFNTTASSSDSFYNGWYIRITSGTGINQVRRIVTYTGATRTATLASAWTTAPSSGDGVSFFNRIYASQFYQKANDRFTLGFTADDPGSSSVTLGDYAALATGAISIFNTVDATGLGTGGGLTVSGGVAVSNRLFVGGNFAGLSNANTIGSIFTTGGNVGLGTSAPSTVFHIRTSTTNPAKLEVTAAGGNPTLAFSNTMVTGYVGLGGDTVSNVLYRNRLLLESPTDIVFTTNSSVTSARFFVGTSGNVGIGNTSPAHLLDVHGNVRISNGSLLATFDSNTIGNVFTTGGNVGIGATGPLNRLAITPTVTESKITLWDAGVSTNIYGFGVSSSQLNYHVDSSVSNHVFYAGGRNGDGTELFRLAGTGTATLSANANGERGLIVKNTNSGSSAYPIIRIDNDTAADTVLFLNSSTRTTDGGVNTFTMRNDAGSLRLLAAGGAGGVWVASTSGNVGISNSGPTYTLDVGGTFQVSGSARLINNSNTIGNLYTTGGNVGINIVSPAYQLDVNGSSNINGDLDVTGSINGGGASSSTFAYLTLTATDEAINLTTGAMVTFGGVSIQAATDASSPTSGGALLTEGGAAIGKRLFVGDGIISPNSNTIGNLFTTSVGSVGIGTTSPQATLDVNGTISAANLWITNETVTNLRVTGNFTSFAGLVSAGTLQSSSLTTGTLLATGNVNTVGNLFTTGGNVGIGTSSPSEMLDVRGNLRVGGSTQGNYISFNGTLGDSTGGSHTYIGERIYGGTERSELLIYKGNDIDATFGPDRIRLLAAEIRLETFTDVSTGSFEAIGVSGGYTRMTLTTTGNIGIGTTSPTHQLHLTNTQLIASTQSVVNTNITTASGGALNVSGDITLGGTRGIYFVPAGLGAPTTTNRSLGTKICLWPVLSGSNLDYAIGVESQNMWFSTSTINDGIKFYQGTTLTLMLATQGNILINSTANATGVGTGGSLTVAGGTSIANDLYVGGTLTVAGQNLTTISGTSTIGNYTGTGVLTISNIAIGRTMSNTNYKILGSLRTTSTISNVYTVSFSNVTTTTFNANILRMDSLFSGWTDPNVVLSWQIIP